MTHWAKPHEWTDGAVDLEVIEESALAMAQSTIQNAINRSGLSQSEMARRMGRNRSFISRILAGSHNLTIRTLARSMAVCGFEVRFQPVALEWNWAASPAQTPEKKDVEPANAGSSTLRGQLSVPEPALAA